MAPSFALLFGVLLATASADPSNELLDILVTQLKNGRDSEQQRVISALSELSNNDVNVFARSGGTAALVNRLDVDTTPAIATRRAAANVIARLASDATNRQLIVDAGAIPALVLLANPPDPDGASARALYMLAQDPAIRALIVKEGGTVLSAERIVNLSDHDEELEDNTMSDEKREL